MSGEYKTQGTSVFYVDTVSATDPEVRQMLCPTAVQGVASGTRDQIETTCLTDTVAKQFIGGLMNTGQVTIPFNLLNDEGHEALIAMQQAGDKVWWAVGLEDGTSDPELNTDNSLTVPDDRSWFTFLGYIAEASFSAAANSKWEGNAVIQTSGVTTFHRKTAT